MTIENAVRVERRTESHKRIESLVAARTKTLAQYSRLAAMQPFNNNKSIVGPLQRFCQTLIDYTASAHFVLYKYIDNNQERRRPVMQLAGQVYPRIVDITQLILDFNDRYDAEKQDVDLSHLAADLSRLGEVLADRIEMEDQLIRVLTQRRG